MADVRIRKFQSKKELERALDEQITMGYEIREQGENSVLVRKKTYGSIGVIILLILFGGFLLWIPLPLYIWYAHTHADTVLMKVEEPEESELSVEPIRPHPAL